MHLNSLPDLGRNHQTGNGFTAEQMLLNDGFDVILFQPAIHNPFRINQNAGTHHARSHAACVGQGDFFKQVTVLNFTHEFIHDFSTTRTGTRTSGMPLWPVLSTNKYMFFWSGHDRVPFKKLSGFFMYMSKTVFWAHFGASFTTDTIKSVFYTHDHAVVIIVFKISIIIIKVIWIKGFGFFHQIENIAWADFKTTTTTYAGFLIDVSYIRRCPFRAAKSYTGYKFRHDYSPGQAASACAALS